MKLNENAQSRPKKNFKELRRRRNMRFFIDAAAEIMQEEGLSGMTIRNVSDRAGFNSSSLYTNFENFDQLITLTCLDIMSDYFLETNALLSEGGNAMQVYLRSWKLYCMHSFANPWPYAHMAHVEDADNTFATYFDLFAEKYKDVSEEFLRAFLLPSHSAQDKYLIAPCIATGYLAQEDAYQTIDFATMLHYGYMWKITQENAYGQQERFTGQFMKFLIDYVKPKLLKDVDLSDI